MSEDDKAEHLAELLSNPDALDEARSKQQAEYMREYRQKNPDAVEANRATVRAQAKALRRLAAEHQEEFYVLYTEERAKEGLPPPRRRNLIRRPRG
jgi:septal ring factor EnvC (AmiA/AmiB activator)